MRCFTGCIRRVDRVTQLKESLNTATWVLGSSTVVTVGQEHDQSVFNVPLSFTCGNKLVNHDLGTISKITKLSLPENKGVRVCASVSIFESKHCKFWKIRVGGDKVSRFILVTYMGRVDRIVVAILVLVENVGMSVRESSPLNILAWKTDVISFLKKRCEGKGLSGTPVNTFSGLNRLHASVEDLNNLRVEFFVFWKGGNLQCKLSEWFKVSHSCVFEVTEFGSLVLDCLPSLSSPGLLSKLKILACYVCCFHRIPSQIVDFLKIFLCDTWG